MRDSISLSLWRKCFDSEAVLQSNKISYFYRFTKSVSWQNSWIALQFCSVKGIDLYYFIFLTRHTFLRWSLTFLWHWKHLSNDSWRWHIILKVSFCFRKFRRQQREVKNESNQHPEAGARPQQGHHLWHLSVRRHYHLMEGLILLIPSIQFLFTVRLPR